MFSYTRTGTQIIEGKVLVIGDSITHQGDYVSFLSQYFKHFQPHRKIEFINHGLRSETVSGLSEASHPSPRPCIAERIDALLACVRPDWVMCCYGMNDGIYHPFNQAYFSDFQQGYLKLIDTIHQFGARVIVLTPPPFDAYSFKKDLAPAGHHDYSYLTPYKYYDQVLKTYSDWLSNHLCLITELVVDLHTALTNHFTFMRQTQPFYLSGDGIHPNTNGHQLIAQTLLKEVFNIHTHHFNATLNWLKHHPITTPLDDDFTSRPVYVGTWNSYPHEVYLFEGYEVNVVFPKKQRPHNPWVWRTEFFGGFATADCVMLEKGYHLIHINLADQYGASQTIQLMKRFQDALIHVLHLNTQCILFGFSRGGLYARHYAATFPEAVCALYLDAPVVDLQSWPCGFGIAKRARREYTHCVKLFDTTFEGILDYSKVLETDLLHLVKAKIPLILVAGDADSIVPYEENGSLLESLYLANYLPFKCILKKGCDHHPHSLEDPTPIVDFLEQFAAH